MSQSFNASETEYPNIEHGTVLYDMDKLFCEYPIHMKLESAYTCIRLRTRTRKRAYKQ